MRCKSSHLPFVCFGLYFAKITIIFMEVVNMELNLMIIGLFCLIILAGAAIIKAEERIEDYKERKTTEDIWYRA